MKVTVAIDSFKGSLSSLEAGLAAKAGVLKIYPDADVRVCPMADGGEGTARTLVDALRGEYVSLAVSDPLGRAIVAEYGYIPDQKTAVIEMASASGITLIGAEERDLMKTSTFGTGEIIKDAILRGCRRFIIGIGGSATNDGGVGMLEALGFRFLDAKGDPVPRGAQGLASLVRIENKSVMSELAECSFTVACDVANPLCGEHGCSAVYGPQKGADAEQIEKMDVWLANFAELTKEMNPDADPDYPGAGAAGGMGFALLSYLNARLTSGILLVMNEVGLEAEIADSDFVITGEGRLDGQSLMGKVPVGVAGLAKKYGKTTLAFSGAVTKDAEILNAYGIDAFFPILRQVCTLEEAMNIENAAENLQKTVAQVFGLIKAMEEKKNA
ncbi:MAG: glycerate kinase [Clostridia bacterium]|nr:glycerate kinase [Clostridia bacterium]